jgi:TusA-related sulfurtransferase
MKIIDTRGHGCPEPVLMTKRALAVHERFEILIDTTVAKENVHRLLKKNGASVEIKEENGEYIFTVTT